MNVGQAIRDESTSLGKNAAKARATMRENDARIAAWIDAGYSDEQAWAKALGYSLDQENGSTRMAQSVRDAFTRDNG